MSGIIEILCSFEIRRWLGNGHLVASRRSETLESKQYGLLQVLAMAHRHRQSPAKLVSGLAEEYRGRYRRKLRRLAERLSAETPLTAALEQTPGALPESSVLMLQFASQTGSLSQAFIELLADRTDLRQPVRSRMNTRQPFGYSAATLAVLLLVATFMLIFVTPTIAKICEEFAVPVPTSLQLFMDVGGWIANYWYLILLLIVLVGVWLRMSLAENVMRRLPAAHWLLPGNAIRSAQLLRLLALSTAAGRPIPAALSALGRYHFDRATRHDLLVARNEVEHGEDVWKSLSDANLLSANETSGLSALADGRSRAWAMRRLAEQKVDRVSWRGHTVYALLHPALVLLLAVLVAWIGIATMQFLTVLMEQFG